MARKRRSSSRRSFGRKKRSPETVFWIVFLIILLLGGSGFFVYKFLLDPNRTAALYSSEAAAPQVEQFEEGFPEWVPKEPVTHTNILLLGLDNHGMSDIVMIISYDMESYDSSIISLKRDTFVPNQSWARKESGQDHLAWANNRGMGSDGDFHAGANLAAYTVEDLLGIDIHAYASISFDGFVEMVDLIGGVELDVNPAFAERQGGSLPTGLQRLNGEQALIYSRHRQNPRIPEPGAEDQAADRVIRNQRLLKAILEQGKSLDSDKILEIIEDLENKFYTSMDDWTILELANILYNQGLDDMKSVILPGEGVMVYQERIDNETYYYYLDFTETDLILQELGLK